jgi:hypothetical protein
MKTSFIPIDATQFTLLTKFYVNFISQNIIDYY